jgi:putative ABC transport system permease protein
MRPSDDELDEEIRAHLALNIKERIEAGEDPEAARRAARREFGNVTLTRDSMRSVWRPRWLDEVEALGRDIRFAVRSLLRAKALAATVIVTLALGIGANAAIFSVVRGVLLRPLVNRDEDRLVYIRQSSPGVGNVNTTFSVPELNDLESRVKAISEFGEFSVVDFAMSGLGGEPRTVRAGVVNGSFFDVMGLRPLYGRLLDASDDGPKAKPVAVVTHHFWTASLNSDPGVVGRTIRVGPSSVTVVGVLEPSVPYPADTEIIANVVTSPHHLGATMVKNREHRMTELFGRLAPGVSIGAARAELSAAHAEVVREHPEAYSPKGRVQLTVTRLRDQIASPARTILLLLLASAAVVFVIACSNVANLILARSVRREGELAVRAALGAGRGALRRTLLAESLVLCGAGAALGVMLARPFIALVARYAGRFSIRALEVSVDSSVLWVGAGLALAAAVLLAYVPRLPSEGIGIASSGVRITPGTSRRLRIFATTQIACSFVLLAGASTLVATLLRLQTANTSYNMRQVLAFDIPEPATGVVGPKTAAFYKEATRRIARLPGVVDVAAGSFVPWRDSDSRLTFRFAAEGYTPAVGETKPDARLRIVGPRFFAALSIPIVAGRDFSADDREPVAIASASLARRYFPNGDAVNKTVRWTEPLVAQYGAPERFRIIGVVADVDDENVVPRAARTIYLPILELGFGGRLFVHAAGDPYALVPAVARTIHDIAPDQPVERAATLEDVRAEVLSPERLNAFVFSGFAGIALLIAVVGVAGVLAFSVSARTREFGVRLAVGSSPGRLLTRVLSEGAAMAAIGIAAGGLGGYTVARVSTHFFASVQMPGAVPVMGAAAILIGAALVASLMPAARASRVDVVQALRSE